MKAVLVGEAWGEREDLFHHALVGPTGQEAGRILHEAGIAPKLPAAHPSELEMIEFWRMLREREILHVTNVFNERPPDNNNTVFFDRELGSRDLPPIKIKSSVKYVLPQYVHHLLRLQEELQTIKPNLVVAMGNIASWATLGQTSITKIRGTVQTGLEKFGNQKFLPTYHPAFILHEGGWANRPVLIADLMKARRQMEFPEIRRPERWITVAETLTEIRQWFNRSAEKYACDIESGYVIYPQVEINKMQPKLKRMLSEQISMVSFARSPKDMLVVQFMKHPLAPGADGEPEAERELKPSELGLSMNFWPKLQDEVEAWRLVINRGLQRPIPKIFQNGVYDIGRFMSMGIIPFMCYEDTMLRHHAMYPEMLKSLGFLASIYVDEVAWKTIYGSRESLKRDDN